MKISKKLVSFMLALAMVVTAMSVQTVPVQAKTKAIKVTNVKGNKLTLYKNETLNIKTNYKNDKVQVVTNDRSVVKVDGMNWIYAGKPGKTKIIVWLKSNHKNQKVINVTVSNKYTATRTEGGGNSVRELYNSKTKKSTYEVTSKGTDANGNKINVSFQFTASVRGMSPTGCIGEVSKLYKNKDATYIILFDMTKDINLKNIEKMTDSDWFKYWDLSKSQIKKSKVEYSSDKKYYKVILKTPNDNDSSKSDYCCYIKNKATGKIYCFEYSNNFIKEYDTIKSIKLI